MRGYTGPPNIVSFVSEQEIVTKTSTVIGTSVSSSFVAGQSFIGLGCNLS